ncbi:unnamed protein product [Brachionus calyciflorus]|uniref:Cyanocobalamin reductase (cyanide-eliminating) n=1 Tax=Brachionus calyciflorus TaxID=104777 RepID=A0A813MEV8_9BILA|nr:unnamed protein product [Brachionus calyciflorus]
MNFENILKQLNSELEPLEFESHPFLIKWYNNHVDDKFKLNYAENTLAVLVINKPKMFDKLFLKFLFDKFKYGSESLESHNDPIDLCMTETFSQIKQKFEEMDNNEIDVIKDFEMMPGNRRPKIIMQTCAHVSGAAYFYDPKKIENDRLNDETNTNLLKKNLMGVCLHSKYGGWFAMRCVFIFKNIILDNEELKWRQPIDPLNGNYEKIIDLLKKFNYNWKDSTYRDVIKVKESYSSIQREYFNLEPKYRKDLIKEWLEYSNVEQLIQTYEKIFKDKNLKNYLVKNFYIV